MNKYTKPVVIENVDAVEGVYALESGENPGFTYYLIWTNHNSGSLSCLQGGVTTGPNIKGNYIKVTCTFIGKGNIQKWGDFGGPYTATTSGNSVTFVRNGSFNPNDNYEFSINNVVFDSGEVSDDGHTGAYYKTGTHIKESAIMDGTWQVDVTIS